jgi:hypothetical protein
MAGNVDAGELTAPPAVRRGMDYAVATARDEAAIRRLLRDHPMRGAVSLSFEREPDYFHGAHLGGADEQTIVAYDRSRLVCMGRCTTRSGWINGEPRRIAYLGELRLDATARGRLSILRGGYAFFRNRHAPAPADFCFTSIAADNAPALRLLEHGVAGLPRYSFLTEFATLVIPVRRTAPRAGPPTATATYPELAEFLNAGGPRFQLAAQWDESRLRSLEAHGLRQEDFKVIRAAGRIVAAAALWDQRAFRQIVVRGYSPLLAGARPLVNLAARVRGAPTLPAIGSILANAFLSPLATAPGHESALPALIDALAQDATRRGLSFLTLGFAANDPRLPLVRRHFSTRTYASRLYQVAWPDEPARPALDARRIGPDLAFL